MATMEERVSRLVDWMRDRASEAGAKGGVFGVSGGVDSALVLALSKRAWPKDCLGLVLPCHSMPEDAADGQLLLELFKCPCRLIDLGPAYDVMTEALPESAEEGKTRLARANLKARLRMATWCYYANLTNRIVVGATNMAERYIGYFTKHADSGVDIMPLASLVKSEVKEMARYLGVPDRIVSKTPSAGLWQGQADEDEMGLSYAHLDAFLLGEKAPYEVVTKIQSQHRSSRHKRCVPPFPDRF